MKWLTKKRRESVAVDQLATRVANFILKIQSGFARNMSNTTKRLSTTSIKWSVLIFLLTGTTFSIYVALSSVSKKQNAITINHLRPSALINSNEPSTEIISKNEYEQLQKFDHFIDSLHNVKSPVYDRMLKFRHGLLDSVKFLESFYKNQFLNQK